MIKVYQTIIDSKIGNCAQAAVASLFNLSLDEVPNFILNHKQTNMNVSVYGFFYNRGYKPSYVDKQIDYRGNSLKELAKYDKGVNGYFYASVKSQTFENCTHAVIVDTDLTVVHDPNPNQLCLGLTYEHVLSFLSVRDWYIDIKGNIVLHEKA